MTGLLHPTTGRPRRLRELLAQARESGQPLLAPGAYDLAFADPPYESRMLDRVLDAWRTTGFARVLAAEHARTHALPTGAERLAFGDTVVTIYRR